LGIKLRRRLFGRVTRSVCSPHVCSLVLKVCFRGRHVGAPRTTRPPQEHPLPGPRRPQAQQGSRPQDRHRRTLLDARGFKARLRVRQTTHIYSPSLLSSFSFRAPSPSELLLLQSSFLPPPGTCSFSILHTTFSLLTFCRPLLSGFTVCTTLHTFKSLSSSPN